MPLVPDGNQRGDPPAGPPQDLPGARKLELSELERRLGIQFTQIDLLEQALSHGSFVHESEGERERSYERLEFLGDSVINLVVSDLLFRSYQDAQEGFLAKARARLVSEPLLARIARNLNLGDYILLGKGEEKEGGRSRDSILADVLEAVVGAIYLDSGYEASKGILAKWFAPLLEELGEQPPADAKSRFQELIQKRGGGLPRYRIVREEGPPHDRLFVAVVEVKGEVMGEGKGRSKKEATEAAASAALERLQGSLAEKVWGRRATRRRA